MNNTKHTIIALAAGLLLAVSGNAQANFGEIKGKITEEETNETLPGVNVWVEVNGSKQGTATDLDGKFTIKPLKPGTYILHASFINKVELQKEVVVYPDQISYENSLVMSDTTLLEVVVQGYEIPLIDPEQTSKKTVNYKDIQHNPNLRDIKKLAGGLTSEIKTSENGNSYVRGGRSDASIYFIDGVKVSGQSLSVPGVAIGSLTVYTGGVPAKYGDVTGGVIIVETKSYMDLYNQSRVK